MKIYQYIKKVDFYAQASQQVIQRIKSVCYLVVAAYTDIRIAAVFSRTDQVSTTSVRIAAGLLILSLTCVMAQAYSRSEPAFTPLYHPLLLISGLYTGFVIFFTCALFVTDIVYVLAKLILPEKPEMDWFTAAAMLAAAIAVAAGYRKSRRLVVTRYQIHPENHPLRKPYRIVQLSDLHIGTIIRSDYISRIVDTVNACHPDLIVITGDVLNHGSTRESRERGGIAMKLSRMKAPDGVYSIAGNHDPDPEDCEFRRFLHSCRITPIDNSVKVTGGAILVGRIGVCTPEYDRVPLTDLLDPDRVKTDRPVIVLDHDPKGIDDAEAAGADLMLSGHTHAGQLFPMTYIMRFYYSPSLVYGYGRQGKTQSIVSSGTGIFQTPIRTGKESEVVCIDLV